MEYKVRRWRPLLSDSTRRILVKFGSRGFGNGINRRLLLSMLEGYRGSALLQVAARLGIADLLATGPRTSSDLAQSTGADASSMRRFLRGLVLFGICEEEPDGRFALTRLGTWLQETRPGSLRAQAIRSRDQYAAWGSLLHSVMTGETAFKHVFGTDVWDYRSKSPELDEGFNKAFHEDAARISRELLSAYDFSSVRTVADIGGGYGSLLAKILQRFPSLSGILFDLPHVIGKAAPYLKEAGIFERCRAVGGSFFTHVPEDADLYILKSVIHDWNDEQSVNILANCRQALKPEARLLLLERIMPARAKQDPRITFLDLRMLIVTGGRERNAGEYRALFEAAGLTLTRILPLPSGFSIIEGMDRKRQLRHA